MVKDTEGQPGRSWPPDLQTFNFFLLSWVVGECLSNGHMDIGSEMSRGYWGQYY